jgi:putative DNA methylase
MFWRRRLPHWVPEDSIVFVTWRLAGPLSKPQPELLLRDPAYRPQEGPRWLEVPAVADLFVEALLYGESVRRSYELFAWVVMPNHVHVVLKPHGTLHEIMHWIKQATAVRANRLMNLTGKPFWQREYFDTWIRTSEELGSVIGYVEENPVRAGLALCAEDWAWSSASKRAGGKTASATDSRCRTIEGNVFASVKPKSAPIEVDRKDG